MSDKPKSQTKNNGGKQPPAKKIAVTTTAQPAAPQKSGGGGIAILAFVTAIGAAGLGYKGWEEANKLHQKLSDQGGQIETSISSALKPAIDSVDAMQSGLGTVQTSIDSLQSDISRLQNELAALQEGLGKVEGGVETLEGAQQASMGEINTSLGEQIQNVQERHGSLEEQQKSLLDNVNALNEGLSTLKSTVKAEAEKDDISAWVLAEVEYLLHIANSRLNLEHDVQTALTALNAAAKQLSELNLPDLTEIQQLITREIEALSAVPQLNIAEMAQALAAIGNSIVQLPLAKPIEATLVSGKSADGDRQQWEVLADEVWAALKPLVTVRNSQDPAMAPLTPEKHAYLTQNLQLKIESARLALLRADNTSYHENLKLANEWITQFYDLENTEGSSMLTALDELQQATIDAELPDISASLSALQKYIASKSLKVSGPHSENNANRMLASISSNSVAADVEIH